MGAGEPSGGKSLVLAWEEVAKARIVAVVRAVKCMLEVADGCVVQEGTVGYESSGGSGVLLTV